MLESIRAISPHYMSTFGVPTCAPRFSQSIAYWKDGMCPAFVATSQHDIANCSSMRVISVCRKSRNSPIGFVAL